MIDYLEGHYLFKSFPGGSVRISIPDLSVTLEFAQNPKHQTSARGSILFAESTVVTAVSPRREVERFALPSEVVTTSGDVLGVAHFADSVALLTPPELTHELTVPALGYILESRPDRKFVEMTPRLAAVAGAAGVVSLFRLPQGGEVCAPSFPAQEHDHAAPILGLHLGADFLILLTATQVCLWELEEWLVLRSRNSPQFGQHPGDAGKKPEEQKC